MIPKKPSRALHGFEPPKVSLRNALQKTTALCLLFAGLGLPSEAASLMSPAFADDSARTAQGSEQWMVGVYQEGKRHYDLGDYDAAQREWDKLSGSYDKNPSLKVIVDFMRGRILNDPETIRRGLKYQEQRNQAFEKQAKAGAKHPEKSSGGRSASASSRPRVSEADVSSFLDQARQDVTRQVNDSAKQPPSLDARRAQQKMIAAFAQGKNAYLAGNFSGAIAAWEEAVSYLPRDAAARRQLEELKGNSVRVAEKRRILPASGGSSGSVSSPADMKDFLELVNARFRAEAQEGRARAAQRSVSTDDRQEAVDRSFQKSKLLYFQGDYEQAIDELNALSKYFSPASEEAQLIAGLRGNYLDALKAQDEAKQIRPAAEVRVESPVELRSFITQAERKFGAMIEEARASRSLSQKTADERRAFVKSALDRSRSYFDRDLIDEALSELERVAPYVENEAEILSLVDEVRARQAEAEKAREDLEAPGPGETKLKQAATRGVTDFLRDAARRVRDETQRIASRKRDADSASRDRARRLADLFQNARSRYDAGDVEGALDLLERMAPDVEDEDEVRRMIDELRADLEQGRRDSEEAKALESKARKYPMPADLSTLLSETRDNIRTHAEEMRRRRDALSRTASEQQRQFSGAYDAGRAAYNAGDLETALREWEKLVPIVENGSELSRYLSDVRRDYQAAMEAEKASQAADTQGKIRLPDDFYELLNQTASQTRSRAQAAASRKQSVESEAGRRQDQVTRAYDAGRTAYNAGDLEKAVAEWQALVPLVEEGQRLGSTLESLKRDYRSALQALEATAAAEKRIQQTFQAPGDVAKFLADAQKQVEARGRDAAARKEALERDSAGRRAAYDQAVDGGRAAYKAGNLEAALNAWQKLAPVVENGPALEGQIAAIREQLRAAQAAKKSAEELSVAKSVSFELPADLSPALSDLSKKLQADIAQSAELKAAAESRAAERQKRVQAAIAEGLQMYKSGLTAEALKKWESALPDLADAERLQKTILDLRQADQELSIVQKTALQAEIDSKKQLPAPADLKLALEGAFSAAKMKLEEAKMRQESAGDESVRRQKFVTESVQNGKMALARGDIEGAVTAWSATAPYLEDGQKLAPRLQELKTAHAQMAETQKMAAAAEERSLNKFKSLPEVEAFITEANLKYKNDLNAANLLKEKAEAVLAEKQALIEHTVRKARASFEQGDIPGASAEALRIAPMVEDPVSLQNEVASIQAAYDKALAAQSEASQAQLRASQTLFKAPPELSLLLKDADMKVKEFAQAAQTQKLEAEQALKEKEAFVQRSFERGKNLYWQGKLDEALAEWDNMAPLLENGGKVKEVTGRYEETLHIQRQAREIAARKDEKFRTPEELQRLLNDAEKILESQSSFAAAKQQAAQDEISGRQEFVNRTFQRGKALYEQGLVPDAIEEWEKLTPVLENGSKVKEFIDSVKTNYRGTLEARKGAEEAEARSITQPQAPADLTRLLNEANEALKIETQSAREERQKSEAALREKQKMVDGIFQKGKMLYQAGRLEEAIDTWKSLLPFVDDTTSVRQLIEQAEESRRQLLAERYEAQNPKSVAVPGAMQFALEESNAALKDKISHQQSVRIEADLRELVGPQAKAPKKSSLPLKAEPTEDVSFPIDEIEQMMLEYKVVTPEELQKRRETLKASVPSES